MPRLCLPCRNLTFARASWSLSGKPAPSGSHNDSSASPPRERPVRQELLCFHLILTSSSWQGKNHPCPHLTEGQTEARAAKGPVLSCKTLQGPALRRRGAPRHSDSGGLDISGPES